MGVEAQGLKGEVKVGDNIRRPELIPSTSPVRHPTFAARLRGCLSWPDLELDHFT